MLYNCKELFERVKKQVAQEIDGFPIEDPPTVCIITTGDDEPSQRYVRNKIRDFVELGIEWEVKGFGNLHDLLCFLIDNRVKSDYDGIIVQRPILVSDATLKEAASQVADFMRPDLDIDGVCYMSPFMPPSVRGLDILLNEWGIDPAGKTAVVIGRGDVGKPVAEYLLKRDATVTICHSKTPRGFRDLAIRDSDIVIGAAGLKEPLSLMWQVRDQVVVDYGITKGKEGKLHGDIAANYASRCKYQTSVPGGMGLMVRAGLLLNIIDAYKTRREIE